MKLKNIGLGLGFTLCAIAIVIGYIIIFMDETPSRSLINDGGGGISWVVAWFGYGVFIMFGMALIVAGAIGVTILIVGWVFAKIYKSLGPEGKKMVQRGSFILSIIGTGIIALYGYQEYQAYAKREAAEQKAAKEKLHVARVLLIGKWKPVRLEHVFFTFKEDGVYNITEDGSIVMTDAWKLNNEKFSPFDIVLSFHNILLPFLNPDDRAKIVLIDSNMLVLERMCIHPPDDRKCRQARQDRIVYERFIATKQEID